MNEEGDTVEGYHLVVGGGFGPDAGIGRELSRDVRAEDVPAAVERLLKAYLRTGPGRTKPSRPSRAGTTSKRCRCFERGGWPT